MTDELKFSEKREYTGVLIKSFGRPPEVKFVGENATPVCNFQMALAYSESKGNHFDFRRVVAWGTKAEIVAATDVGSWLTVKGVIYSKNYTDKNGEKVYYKDLKIFDDDNSLIFHGQPEGQTGIAGQLTNDLGGTDITGSQESATPPPF